MNTVKESILVGLETKMAIVTRKKSLSRTALKGTHYLNRVVKIMSLHEVRLMKVKCPICGHEFEVKSELVTPIASDMSAVAIPIDIKSLLWSLQGDPFILWTFFQMRVQPVREGSEDLV